ncbi:MAG: glycosyltransferase family 39 protein, partial [Chloroflexota bacterium]
NTQDGLLVFILMLAAWAVLHSVETGKLRYLLFSFTLIGLGFNIKMLQAYMVLPALFAVYFFCTRHNFWKKVTHLGIAVTLLLFISLSWAIAVDSVSAENRPFIGSSTDNTVMELIVGHNGVKRILGNADINQVNTILQAGIGLAGGGRGVNTQEVGQPGIFRLISLPLADQAGWLLFPALSGLVLAVLMLGKTSLTGEKQTAVILWSGWLLPMLLYFSFTSGLWHTYYLVML